MTDDPVAEARAEHYENIKEGDMAWCVCGDPHPCWANRLADRIDYLENELAEQSEFTEHLRMVIAARDRLLARYGAHTYGCALRAPYAERQGVTECTCGLDDALNKHTQENT